MDIKEKIAYYLGKPKFMKPFRHWYWSLGNMWLWGVFNFIIEEHKTTIEETLKLEKRILFIARVAIFIAGVAVGFFIYANFVH